MSLTPMSPASGPHAAPSQPKKKTTHSIREKKSRGEAITCLTAYDYWSARLVDEAGVDMVLVGDSLAQVVLGHENTMSVTVDEMLHHTRAARRGVENALLIADMPYGSYHSGRRKAVANAVRFVKEAGAEAVKLEGGEKRAELVRAMLDAEVPVMGHIGLTPQSLHAMGGYKVQGKTSSAVDQLMRDAAALDHAGVFAMVLEGMPAEVAAMITAQVSCPTIGIGAGADCDGQVLVLHDILGLTFTPPAKFVRKYADVATIVRDAAKGFIQDVETHAYPTESESYHLPREIQAAMENVITKKRRVG
jgi:3-methyl-2-oxobutanoate hydroxymethyltransferase